jgi:ribosomal protein S18 acetylase RimI-like enzyme
MRIIRPATAEDIPFIMATWLRSQYYGSPWFREIPPEVYFAEYRAVVERYLSNSITMVSCLATDPDIVLGYSVYSPLGVLRWIYVKKAWRRQGVAKSLFRETTTEVSSMSRIGRFLMPATCTFNPFV